MAPNISITHQQGEHYEIVITAHNWTVKLIRSHQDFYDLHQSLPKPPAFPVKKKTFLAFLFNQSIQLHQYLTSVLARYLQHERVVAFMAVGEADSVYTLSSIGPQFPNGCYWRDNGNSDAFMGRLTEMQRKKRSLDDFELLKVLGKGCMGKVLLAKDKSSASIYAIKSISKQWVMKHGRTEVQHTKDEQNILASVSHPFLIHLHCSFQTPDNLFLVLEYVSGGDLATQLAMYGKFPLPRARFYAAEIVEGIKELHRLGIIYRDLKPENVLLHKSGHIRLTDFGLSKLFKLGHKTHQNCECPTDSQEDINYRTKTFCGTAEYLAPEILLEKNYSFEVDWWSLATFLYEMIFAVTPFWSENQAVMYNRILNDTLEFPSQCLDADLMDLVSRMLIRDPARRLGTGQSGGQEIQRHPFFTKHLSWDDLYKLRIQPPFVPQVNDPTDVRWFDDMFTNMTPRISPAPMSPLYTAATAMEAETAPPANLQFMQGIPETSTFEGYTFVSSSIGSRIARYNAARKLSPNRLSYVDEIAHKKSRINLSSLHEHDESPPVKSPASLSYLGESDAQFMEFQMEL